MAQKAANANCMNIKVFFSKKTQRILYAEAGKDFVDLLFSFLVLPSGAIVKVLSETGVSNSVGCITNIYDSADKLHSVIVNGDKSDLLQPKIAPGSASNLLPVQYSTPVTTYYVCPNHAPHTGNCKGTYEQYRRYYGWSTYGCSNYVYRSEGQHNVSPERGQTCGCGKLMDTEVNLVGPASSADFVEETFTYIISDDLCIKPASPIATLALLNKFNVNDWTELEERNFTVGLDEALHLLRASLVSKTVLNDVFGGRLRFHSLIKKIGKRFSCE